MEKWTRIATLAIAVGAGWAGAASAADPAFGYWLSESRKAIVEVQPCGAGACGRIVWLVEPKDAVGQPKTDIRNEDQTARGRPLCGLTMIGDFESAGPGSWKSGFIYNPEDGKTYTAKMALQDDGTLKVRGYVGVSLLGKSQTWTRETNDRGGC